MILYVYIIVYIIIVIKCTQLSKSKRVLNVLWSIQKHEKNATAAG